MRAILPQQTSFLPHWTIRRVKQALQLHQQGTFSQSALLFDSLLEDDEFPGDLLARVNATLRSSFRLLEEPAPPGQKPGGGSYAAPAAPGAAEESPIEEATDHWCCMAPYGELRDFLACALIMGVAVGTLDWDTISVPGTWIPVFRALPIEWLRWDVGSRTWKYQVLAGPEETVTPGDGRWVLYSGGQRGWLWGYLRGIALLWLGKQVTYCDWQRYNQKHGLPIFKAMLPIYGDEDEKKEFVEDLSSLQNEGIVGLPQDENGAGYDLDLLEPTAIVWQSFQSSLERSDRKMQVMLRGGNLGAEVTSSGGNMGAAQTHSDELSKLALNDAKILADVLQKQLLKLFFDFNYGPDPEREVPYPFWDTCPELDARSWTTAQSQFATAVNVLATSGYKISNIETVAAGLGLELEAAPPLAAAGSAEKPPGKPGAASGSNASTAK